MMVIQLLKRSSGNYVRHCFGGAVASLACEYHTTARHWCAQNADHFATSSPFSAFFIEVVCDLGAIPPRTTAAPPPIGGNCIIRAATRRRYTASQFLMLQNPHRHRCGALRTGRRTWLRCLWAVAGPGRASRSTTPSEARVWRSRGRPGPTAPGTPVGLQATPRGADGSRAGRRRRAHRAARSRGRDLRRLEHPWGHKQPGSTQQRARSAAAPRAPHVCQWLTG